MKKIIFLGTSLLFFYNLFSQQAFTERLILKDSKNKVYKNYIKSEGGESFSFKNLSTVGIYGIGNINSETFNSINGSGKLSGFIRPLKKDSSFITVYFSFNKNASNSDSLLASTLLFPDIGNNSFLSTAEYTWCLNSNKDGDKGLHLLNIFYEFSTKNIKGRNNNDSLHFTTINHVFGVKYAFLQKIDGDDVSFSLSPFFAIANIADQDNDDFRKLFNKTNLPSHISSLGVKIAFQYNNLQAYADLRHVFGSENTLPRNLRGFNANIGFVFNAEIFEK